MKRVYLVRHGQTVGNLGKFFQFSDTELSEAGHEGGKSVAERFRHIEVDLLLASQFTRAQQTAEYISEVVGVPVTTEEDFHEKLHMESMRGVKHASEEGATYKKEHSESYWNEGWKPDGAENFFDVIKRVESGVKIIENSESKNIVVVSHGDYIRSFVTYLLLQKSTDVATNRAVFNSLHLMSNVGVSEFLYDEGDWKLKHWNDHAHFAE